jgi:hypothetical protein
VRSRPQGTAGGPRPNRRSAAGRRALARASVCSARGERRGAGRRREAVAAATTRGIVARRMGDGKSGRGGKKGPLLTLWCCIMAVAFRFADIFSCQSSHESSGKSSVLVSPYLSFFSLGLSTISLSIPLVPSVAHDAVLDSGLCLSLSGAAANHT